MIVELYGYRLEQDYYQPFHEPKEEVTIPHAELELIKIIGQRMREARGLCKYSQTNAARLIGFSQKDLKYIENGITQFISLMTLKRAAQVYDVSTDYLLGLNDDWESASDVRAGRDISAFLLTNQIELFSRVAARQLRIERKKGPLSNRSTRFGRHWRRYMRVLINSRHEMKALKICPPGPCCNHGLKMRTRRRYRRI